MRSRDQVQLTCQKRSSIVQRLPKIHRQTDQILIDWSRISRRPTSLHFREFRIRRRTDILRFRYHRVIFVIEKHIFVQRYHFSLFSNNGPTGNLVYGKNYLLAQSVRVPPHEGLTAVCGDWADEIAPISSQGRTAANLPINYLVSRAASIPNATANYQTAWAVSITAFEQLCKYSKLNSLEIF